MSVLAVFQGEVDPETLAGRYLQKHGENLPVPGRILCLGKASPGLARAASSRWPGVPGLLYGTSPHGPVPQHFTTLWGEHPFPSRENLRRTEAVRRWLLQGEGPLLALISGGGSALLVAPREPWGLEEKLATTSALWRSGAPIREVNEVRSRLSEVKAGGLLHEVRPWPCSTLVWSDVGPKDWRIVSSGPTIPVRRGERAEAVLQRYALRPALALPPPKASPKRLPQDSARVLFGAVGARRALACFLRARGFAVREISVPEGTTAECLAEVLMAHFPSGPSRKPRALVGAGEAVVRVASEGGRGGRCSHLAAAVALRVVRKRGDREWAFAAIATDGADGNAGGGAWVDSDSLPSEKSLEKSLESRDTGSLWKEQGTALPRNPMGNNLRDLWVLVEC